MNLATTITAGSIKLSNSLKNNYISSHWVSSIIHKTEINVHTHVYNYTHTQTHTQTHTHTHLQMHTHTMHTHTIEKNHISIFTSYSCWTFHKQKLFQLVLLHVFFYFKFAHVTLFLNTRRRNVVPTWLIHISDGNEYFPSSFLPSHKGISTGHYFLSSSSFYFISSVGLR